MDLTNAGNHVVCAKADHKGEWIMRIISLKCPECNANLAIENDRKQCFCQYCGTKITIDDGSITHTYRKVDEARIREADVKENIRLRELAIEAKKLEAKENTKRQKVKATIILGMIGLLCFFIASIGGIFGLGPIGIVGFIVFAFIAKMWFF